MGNLGTVIVVATVLQIAQVVGGHFNQSILNLAGVWGVGIPFLLAIPYGMRGAADYKSASGGGFLIGIVGAVLGVLLAIVMGDQPWMLLTFAPISSAILGAIGAVIGRAMGSRTPA